MSLREEIKEAVSELVIDYDRSSVEPDDVTEKILKIFEKQMQDLEKEYRKRQIFELDKKVVFEDIQDLLNGKTYKEIFYVDEES